LCPNIKTNVLICKANFRTYSIKLIINLYICMTKMYLMDNFSHGFIILN
jgi:hypothetical protein